MNLVERRKLVEESHKIFPHIHRWIVLNAGPNSHYFHMGPWCYSSHPDNDASVTDHSCPCQECLDLFDQWLNGDLDDWPEYR
jgi:hypothetical protein